MKNLDIIFEDENLLVINKPAGLVVHEGSGQTGATLVDWLAQHLPASPLQQERYGLLHRLDKGTSGLLLVAKTKDYFQYLKNLFKQHKIDKTYLALVHGRLTPRRGVIKIPLARDLVHRTKFGPTHSGKLAETKYDVIDYSPEYTYLRVTPKTGRTHQIRVHLAGLGYPIVGDETYGRKSSLNRQFLHAYQLVFTDPTGKQRQFEAPLPHELKKFLDSSR